MTQPAASSSLTPREYLAMERAAANKHQYWNGDVFAMAGATFEHNQIVGNLMRVLGTLLLEGPCVVLPSDMKVHVPARHGYVYPDVSIVCGPPDFTDDNNDVITNPSVIVEVLSESTERFDRGQKFTGYRSLPSLTDYLLVAQHEAQIEHYTRGDDMWMLRVYGSGQRMPLDGVGALDVDDIYAKVALARG